MWRNWLNTDPSANWEKLFKAIESQTEFSYQTPNKGNYKCTACVSENYAIVFIW